MCTKNILSPKNIILSAETTTRIINWFHYVLISPLTPIFLALLLQCDVFEGR